ncbi:MAG: hypothetical protein N2712_07885, partial [Brevinematales bacterium]|nr:hypothetical protein [Brevinematales bacterium]
MKRNVVDKINQLQIIKNIVFRIISFFSCFENNLVKIWNKPRLVKESNYVITLDRIANKDSGINLIEKILRHKGMIEQVKEWKELGIVGDDFN